MMLTIYICITGINYITKQLFSIVMIIFHNITILNVFLNAKKKKKSY